LWGLLSFVTNFIPNIGFVIGVIPPALLALLEGGWGAALVVIGVYSGLNIIIQTFIQPRYVGASVGLSVEMTFLSLVVWAFLLGPLGALLAVPMTLLIRAVLIDPDPKVAWVTPLISTVPRTPSTGRSRRSWKRHG
jgi:predicted PurR-regulated permease PerM